MTIYSTLSLSLSLSLFLSRHVHRPSAVNYASCLKRTVRIAFVSTPHRRDRGIFNCILLNSIWSTIDRICNVSTAEPYAKQIAIKGLLWIDRIVGQRFGRSRGEIRTSGKIECHVHGNVTETTCCSLPALRASINDHGQPDYSTDHTCPKRVPIVVRGRETFDWPSSPSERRRVSPVDGHADQSVADEPDDEHQRVQHDQHPFGLLRRYVLDHEVLVLFVRHVGHLVVLGRVVRGVRRFRPSVRRARQRDRRARQRPFQRPRPRLKHADRFERALRRPAWGTCVYAYSETTKYRTFSVAEILSAIWRCQRYSEGEKKIVYQLKTMYVRITFIQCNMFLLFACIII